jgi:hypothetical protein
LFHTRIFIKEAKTNGMKRSLGASAMTRFTLPLGIACRQGKDKIKKLVVDYKEGRIENALKREQLGE